MSNTPVQEPPTQGLSSGSGQTLPSRPLQPSSDPSASKRVCFYKSGDYQFGGHRMVINARTFKTFDALLDALSKKVPLPFGVRTITTPRGTHLVRALDDLLDGGAYVCSDQKRVKPLNLDEVNRRQVPWNTTRPLSVGRRRRQGLRFGQSGSRNEATNRPAKVTERVAVRTPKKLMVIKNRDPAVKRTIVLQRRTAPTFDALLDYLSQILQFPVLKLYSTDGRRVDGLAALILCSGVVVAAGNEPFRLANYSFHRTGQMAQAMYVETVEPSMLQPRTQKKKSLSSGRGSRNFSVSSERHIVNQINKSQNGHLHPHNGSFETEANQHHTSMETSGTGRADNVHQTCIVPHDDDIEKSFRVNQDGSMTVEMKVRLTIKEEEMLHWTTTLSRSSLSKRTACASISESGNRSPDSNNAIAKDSSSISEEEMKEENYPPGAGKCFNDERTCEGYTSTATGKAKKSVKRTPTPGPRHVKKASVESVKRVTESGVQESTLGHYSYMERTADGETTEGYCVVRHSSSSNRPIPKPRKTASAGASKKCSTSSIRSSGVAEVLQIQNNGMEFTETVMHIYETQGSYDNYFANQEYSVDGIPLHGSPSAPESKQSTDSGPHSSSNDCDIDCNWQPPTADSLQRQKEEMLSLSSEPVSLTHENANNLSSPSENETQRNLQIQERVKLDNTPKSTKKKKMTAPARSQKSSASTNSTDKKTKENLISPSENSKHSSTDKLSGQASVGKRSLNSSESAKSGQKSKGTEKKAESLQSKKSNKDEKTPRKNSASLVRTEKLKRTPQRQNPNKAAASDNGHNVNTPTGRPQMKKNMSDILQPNKSLLLGKKKTSKPKSMPDSGISQTKTSISLPSLDPSPSEIHQYVENWLEKVSPDQALYPEEAITEGTQPRTKVVFQIGGDSESDEKNECQTNLDEDYPMPDDVIKKSTSCLSVPLSHEELATAQGLSVSMPNVRAELVHRENRLRLHQSVEAIGPAANEASSSNFLSPKAKIKPALQQLCSSIQCIRRASDANIMPNLEKSSSLPDFPTQVASVFGSSCKAFLSFLSVMTLRDHLTGYTPGKGNKSSSTSEAMLMMESLQKISAIEDEEQQRSSLTDLQSRSSSRFRQNWKDFQLLRERLESEPLSPKVSETEFALDVVSEGGDAFEEHNLGIDELMEELSMPQDLRDEIASTIKTFYPVEESQCVETDRNQSESEEDVEQFVQESNDEMKQPDSDSRCVTEDTSEDISETKHSYDGAVYTKLGKITSESGQPGEAKESQTEKEELLKDKENETKEEGSRQEEKLEEEEEVKIEECEDTKETEADSEGTQKGDRESEEVGEEQKQSKSGEVSGEESTDNEEADEEVETKEEDGRKEEQLEEEDEVKIREYGNTKETEAVSEGSGKGNGETEEEGVEEPEQSKSGEASGVESIDNEEAGADEEEETKEEEGRKEEQLEGVEEVTIRGYENTKETEAVSERTDKEDRETEEEGEEEPEQSEEMIGEESINKGEAGADEEEVGTDEEEEEMTLDEKELGVELEEREKEEADETEEAFMNEDSTQYSAEETDEREGAEETEEEEKINEKVDEEGEEESSDEGENEERQEEKKDVGENMEETNEGEEVENVTEEVKQVEEEEEEEEEENGELHTVPGDVEEEIEEEVEEGTEVSDNEEKEIGDITESDEVEEMEAETNAVTVTDAEEEVTEKGDENMEIEAVIEDINEQETEEEEETEQIEEVSKRNSKEEEEVEEEREQEGEFEEEGVGESVVKNTEEESTRITTDEEDVDEGRETDIEDEKYDEAEDSRREPEQTESNQEEESAEERKCIEELEMNENLTAGQIGDEEEREDDEEKESQEKLDQEEKQGTGSPSKYSSEGQCADDKGNGTDTVTETDEGGETLKETNGNLSHPVEISQELLDFVNYALQSSSLIFIYDTEGNIRIEPDNAQVVQTKQTIIPKSRKDSSYGLKRLPSPSTSDLSDYRPGTSESGGYKTQDSVDIMSESGEEASEKPSQVYTHSADRPERTNVELVNSKLSVASNSETFHISSVSGTKSSREDLSYFRSASSLKTGGVANTQAAQCISFVSENSADGVLIDQGRWLLKENHLIRKSPPVSLGMYSNLDSTSLDTGQENTSDDSPPHFKTQHNPLAAISSSELEELAKPPTPKCIYYNMPHGSDSDPFLDDCSVKSSARGRGVRVSPTIDTSKTWANKNGSQSSFASVEFRIPDRKVHPEEEAAVVTQPRRTSGGEDHVLQSQDSVDNLHLRCGQYCPIL